MNPPTLQESFGDAYEERLKELLPHNGIGLAVCIVQYEGQTAWASAVKCSEEQMEAWLLDAIKKLRRTP